MAPFYGEILTKSRLRSHYEDEDTGYFLPYIYIYIDIYVYICTICIYCIYIYVSIYYI